MKTIKGYHFTGPKLRNGDPIPRVGRWLKYKGPVVPCASGLHASEHPFDALRYAPGNLLHRVELRGGLQSHGDPVDKWVGRERRILASIDAEKMLRDFARWNARNVLQLWNAPQVVKDYLETGDEKLRAAARAVAWDAAGVAWDAAGAAWAAGYAARAAAWAAGAAGAAGDAAWDAAWDAAGAAWAAWDAARTKFNEMVIAAFDI